MPAWLVLILIAYSFSVWSFSVSEEVCIEQNPCRCVLDNHTAIDLSTVGLVGLPLFSDIPGEIDHANSTEQDVVLYSYNPCYSFTKIEAHSFTDAGDYPCVDVAACRLKSGGKDGKPPEIYALGFQNTAHFYKSNGFIYINYTVPKTERNFTVKLICNNSETNYLSIMENENETNLVTMELATKCACPGTCEQKIPKTDPHGLSTGSILLITFFVILLVYLVLGITWNFCNGAQGQELIPNIEFWNELPKLIIEGFLFTCTCFSRRTTYGEV